MSVTVHRANTLTDDASASADHDLRGSIAALQDELAGLKARLQSLGVVEPVADASTPEPTAATQPDRRHTRRLLVGRVAAAMAGLGFASSLSSQAVSAQTNPPPKPAPKAPTAAGSNLIIGVFNNRTSGNQATMLRSDPATLANPATLIVSQDTDVDSGLNVLSSANTYVGSNTGALVGLHLRPPTANNGVVGIVGAAEGGIGLVGAGRWPLKLTPFLGSTPLTADAANNFVGDGVASYTVDANSKGALWFSMNTGSTAPFRRIASQDQLGLFVATPTPVRVLDTRPTSGGVTTTGFDGVTGNAIVAGLIASGASPSFRIGGKTFGSVTFPTDITGIVGNVTLVQDPNAGLGGFVTVSGVAGAQNTSSLNAVGSITGNYRLSKVTTNNIFVYNVGVARHIVIDIYGYYLT